VQQEGQEAKMKVCLIPNERSRAVDRVVKALVKYKPDNIHITSSVDDADLVVLHVIGRQDRTGKQIARLNKPYAVIQYSLRSTMRPKTGGWLEIWEGANLVWSYLDLEMYCNEDGEEVDFNFYHSPLGCDPNVFYPSVAKRDYLIGFSSQSYVTESAREIVLAAGDRKIMFLGRELNRDHVDCYQDVSDAVLASLYSRCKFVAGLRRTEGFELPALEGLLCGARPILFDCPHYRQWFDEYGIFIPEGSRDEVIASLQKIFDNPSEYHGPTIEQARQDFAWKPIIERFWLECLL
jgi:hypothetical protein